MYWFHGGGEMRSEHKSRGDEIDMRAGYWDRAAGRFHYWYIYIARPGVRKSIKAASHRMDRRRIRQRVRSRSAEHLDDL